MNNIKYFIVLVTSLVLGVVLLNVYSHKYNNNRINYDNQFTTVNGTIISVEKNPFICFHETTCNKCLSGKDYPPCKNLLLNNQTGYCQCSKQQCCQEICDYYDNDDDFNHCDSFTCVEWNYKPLGSIIKDTCFHPYINIRFITKQNQTVNGTLSTNCKPNNIECADKFIKNYHAGDSVLIKYLTQTPTEFYLNHYPKYKEKKNVKVALIFGYCAIFFAVILTLIYIIDIVIYVNNQRYQYTPLYSSVSYKL